MKIFTFGNGNLSLDNFITLYKNPLATLIEDQNPEFLLCDFRGTDTLLMEFLKTATPHVTIYHIGDKPRYTPDSYQTAVSAWKFKGGFTSDKERDHAAIIACTHFLAYDFNSDPNRKSGTQRNIETCLDARKINLRIPVQ